MTKEECKGIWVFAEQENGVLSGTDFELLAKAHDLKEKLGGTDTVTAVLLGDNVAGLVDTLYAYGAEQVILAENANLKDYSARPYEKVLVELANKYKPSIFLFAASPIGRDVAPRVMCDLRTGLAHEAALAAGTFSSPDLKEGVSAFLGKRKPDFASSKPAK